MDPPSNAPHPNRHTMAMASGLVEPRDSSNSGGISYGASQGRGSGEYDGAPPSIGIQRFDTAPEDPFGLDGDGDDSEEETSQSGPQQSQYSTVQQPQSLPQSQLQPQSQSQSQSQSQLASQPEVQRRRNTGHSISTYSTASKQSIPPPGSVLTGKQEHCM